MNIGMDENGVLYVAVWKSRGIIGWERLPLAPGTRLNWPAVNVPLYIDPGPFVDMYWQKPSELADLMLRNQYDAKSTR